MIILFFDLEMQTYGSLIFFFYPNFKIIFNPQLTIQFKLENAFYNLDFNMKNYNSI